VAVGPMVAATRLGGLGKTQLAGEFAHRYGQYFAGGVFWVNSPPRRPSRMRSRPVAELGGCRYALISVPCCSTTKCIWCNAPGRARWKHHGGRRPGPRAQRETAGAAQKGVPEVTQVAVLVHRAQPKITPLLRETAKAARALGMRLHVLDVWEAAVFERACETAMQEGRGALLILPGLLFSLHDRRLAALTVQHRLPAIYTTRAFAEAGELLVYDSPSPPLPGG
jgi:hypothetical protein